MNFFKLILGLMISTSASAMTMKDITIEIEKTLVKKEIKRSEKPVQPLREATAAYMIQRLDFVNLPDGSFEAQKNEVCNGEMKIDVFDMRGPTKSFEPVNMGTSCIDVSNNKKLWINAMSFLSNEVLIKKNEDIKLFWGGLWVGNEEATSVHIASSVGGTKDLNAKSMIIGIAPMLDRVPGKSYYTVVFDIQD